MHVPQQFPMPETVQHNCSSSPTLSRMLSPHLSAQEYHRPISAPPPEFMVLDRVLPLDERELIREPQILLDTDYFLVQEDVDIHPVPEPSISNTGTVRPPCPEPPLGSEEFLLISTSDPRAELVILTTPFWADDHGEGWGPHVKAVWVQDLANHLVALFTSSAIAFRRETLFRICCY